MTGREKRLLYALAAAVGVWWLSRRGTGPKVFSSEQRRALIEQEAMVRGISPALALAFFEVESGSKGFAKDGRMIIRYEPHIFRRRTEKNLGVEHSVPRTGGSQDAQYKALAAARAIDDTSGLESISMGSSQIMGFNAKRIGYPDVQSMWAAFNASEGNHIRGFFKFIDTSSALTKAIKTGDYRNMARYYNGSGGVGVYDPKIKAAHQRWQARGYA